MRAAWGRTLVDHELELVALAALLDQVAVGRAQRVAHAHARARVGHLPNTQERLNTSDMTAWTSLSVRRAIVRWQLSIIRAWLRMSHAAARPDAILTVWEVNMEEAAHLPALGVVERLLNDAAVA